MTNRDRVGGAFGLLADGLAGPVDNVMRKAFDGQENWNDLWSEQDAQPGRKPQRYSKSDPQILLKAITNHKYGNKFGAILKWHERAWASELVEIRNLWAHNEPISDEATARALDTIQRLLEAVGASDQARELRKLRSDIRRVLVGGFADVGADYQRRGFDGAMVRLWADAGDRRLWLRGGQGLGKSYSARRVMQEAVGNQGTNREDLLIWVDSADISSVTERFAVAVDELRQQGFPVPGGAKDPAERKARALIGALKTSTWRWLIVLDNADAGSLIEARLIPPGGNPNGRVLITTLNQDHRISSNGRVVSAGLFTPEEADEYLRSGVHSRGLGPAPLSLAHTAETTALAKSVGYHPLALSVAAATIVANAMTITDWISEFAAAAVMDAAADEADKGGYPHLIGATWQIALDKASQGLPDGVVERAAMVAALQDPDGNPTWLWERDRVTRWVTDGSPLVRHHGVPVAIQRLIDCGVIELHGDTWKRGVLAIHQLAARAVRELASATTLAELAAILADEWLLQLTEDEPAAQPGAIRRNIRPIAALPDLPTPTRQTVSALLGFSSPRDREFLAWQKENFEDLAALLERGGTIGQARLASELGNIGAGEEELGRHDDAQATYARATQIYRQLIEDPSVDDDLRAGYQMDLGKLAEKLGQTDAARESLTRAARLYERLTEMNPDSSELGSYLVNLVELHEKLGNREKKDAFLGRADDLMKRATGDDASSADKPAKLQQAKLWRELASQLRALGRPNEAKEYLARAAEMYQQAESEGFAATVTRELARLHMATGQWDEAEDCLARLVTGGAKTDDLVLLASVQLHTGRRDDAEKNLSRAAGRYPTVAPEADEAEPANDEIMALLRADAHQLNKFILEGLIWEAVIRQQWDDATGLATAALDMAQRRAEASPGGDYEAQLASNYLRLGLSYHQLGQFDIALMHLMHSVRIRQVLAELDPDNDDTKQELADAFFALAGTHRQLGRLEDAVDYGVHAVNLFQQLADLAPSAGRGKLSLGLVVLGWAYAELGLEDESIDCLARRLAVWQPVADQSPGDRTAQSELAGSYSRLGFMYIKFGRWEEAADALGRSIDTRKMLADEDLGDDETQQDFATDLWLLGLTHLELDRPEEAVNAFSQSVSRWQPLAERDPGNHETQNKLANALAMLGSAFAGVGRLKDAADCLTRSVNIYQLLADLSPGENKSPLINVLRQLEGVLRELGRSDEAEETSTRAADIERGFHDPDTEDKS